MEKKEVGVDNPVIVAGVTVIPVVKLSLNYWSARNGISLLGNKQPTAVVVVSPKAKKAFRITGEEVSLDELIKEVAIIKEMLEGL